MTATILDEFEDDAPDAVAYKPVGAAWDLFYEFTPEKMDVTEIDEILFDGPAGCVAGETKLWDPVAKRGRRIDELCVLGIRPTVLTLDGPVLAEVPFLKGFAPLYRVTLASGRSVLTTAHHRMLSPQGWIYVADLVPGTVLLSVHDEDAPHLSGKLPSCSAGCCYGSCQDGGRPLCGREAVQAFAPSRGDVHEHSHVDHSWDALESTGARSHPDRQHGRLSNARATGHAVGCLATSGAGNHAVLPSSLQRDTKRQFHDRFDDSSRHPRIDSESSHCAERTPVCLGPSYEPTITVWDEVSSVRWERDDFYFDLTVPVAGHYIADGIVHKNTGKTLAALVWIHAKMMEYPGTNVLIARKTRESMSSSCLRTFEEQVLSIDAPDIMAGRDRTNRPAYIYQNGSRATIGGITDIDRLKSAEYDIIYINEVTEVLQEDYEILLTRLRPSTAKNRCPYKLLLSDCNPSYPTHYINERFNQDISPSPHRWRMMSKHEDNPRWYNAHTQTWNEEGRVYIRKLDSIRNKTTKARMRFGLWTGETGQVYEEFESNYHVIDRKSLPPMIYYIGAYDPSPSSNNASVMQMWGIDEEGRGYMVEEAHMIGKGIDWWAQQAVKFWSKYRPKQIVCDPSNPGMIELFNNRISARNGNPMSRIAIQANNDREAGIAQVKSCLEREVHMKSCPPGCKIEEPHGKARIFLVKNCLTEYDFGKDQDRKSNRPRSTAEEFLSLVWKKTKDGQPEKDHWDDSIPHDGLDCVRYFCMFNEQRGLGTKRAKNICPYPVGTVGYDMWKEGRFKEPKQRRRVAL